MRLLLLQSYLGRREPPVAPLGLASLAAHLSDHTLRLFDPNVARRPLEDTRSVIQDFQPDLIGLSLRNIDTTKYSDPFFYFEHFQRFVQELRKLAPRAVLVVGGSGFSLFPRLVLERVPELAAGFFLEADVSFPEFLCRGGGPAAIPGLWYRDRGTVTFSGPGERLDFDRIPPPAWELVDLAPYARYADRAAVGVETKRGCALACAYCTYPQLSGSGLRLKDPARVAAEVETLAQRYGVQRVFFCDPVFNHPAGHAQAVCRALLDRGVKVRWGAYQQDRYLTAEYIALARQSGCDEFYLSPDAATASALKTLGKATTVESLHRSLGLLAQDGQARVSYNFFAAVPGSGWKDFLAAARFLLRARRRLGRRLIRYKFSYIRPEPGTPLARLRFGEAVSDEALLPRSAAGLKDLFCRRSRSPLLNTVLALHFHYGLRFGRKNVLAGSEP
ncbi:MAG: radical SAM protein [Candidatus Zixiibacteriota bacterium]|nr:MAG: radical SAM protein [candidate division Zixibacteria bacterium]